MSIHSRRPARTEQMQQPAAKSLNWRGLGSERDARLFASHLHHMGTTKEEDQACRSGRSAQWHAFFLTVIVAKAHHMLDAGAALPTAVKQHAIARRGQMLHTTLKVPLPALHFAGFLPRHRTCNAWIQVFHEALDGAALARCVAPLKQDQHTLSDFFHPGLQFERLHLQWVWRPPACPGLT